MQNVEETMWLGIKAADCDRFGICLSSFMNFRVSPNNWSNTETYWSDNAEVDLDTEQMQRNNSR